MRLSLWLGWRFLGALGQGRGWSLLATLSVTGLVLGVAALLAVLSVMRGFQETLQDRLLSATPHLLLEAHAPLSPERLEALGTDRRLQALAPFAATPVLFSAGSSAQAGELQVLGAGAEALFPGGTGPTPAALASLEPGEVLLGRSLAARLGLFPGDRVSVLVPEAAGETLRVRALPLKVRDVFTYGAEVDQTLALTRAESLTAAGFPPRYSWRLTLTDPREAPAFAQRWGPQLGDAGHFVPWTERFGALFEAVTLERRMMGLVVGLIIAVALFNLVASLTRLVEEKRGAIAMLMTQGASRRQVAQLFLAQGVLLGVAGSALGAALGYLLAENAGAFLALAEQLFSFSFLGGTYFQSLPSAPAAEDFLAVGLAACAATVFAAAYPAWRASQVLPARALH
ncbi:MAG: ABC transporter permease [Pseudomonadales bacterium]|nr:ABC transporter permease [Pseudomonadales bacterium]